jgi:hypothetical protein
MRARANTLGFTVLILIAATLSGCTRSDEAQKSAWKEHDSSLAAMEKELEGLSKAIKGAQGQGLCATDGECQVVGLGTRSCGHFANYLVFSKQGIDEPRLLELVSKFNELFEKRVKLSLQAESCGVPPGVVKCVSKRCSAG